MDIIVESILETFVEGFSKEVNSLNSRLLAFVFVFFYFFVVIGLLSIGIGIAKTSILFGFVVILLALFIAGYFLVIFLKKLAENKKEHSR